MCRIDQCHTGSIYHAYLLEASRPARSVLIHSLSEPGRACLPWRANLSATEDVTSGTKIWKDRRLHRRIVGPLNSDCRTRWWHSKLVVLDKFSRSIWHLISLALIKIIPKSKYGNEYHQKLRTKCKLLIWFQLYVPYGAIKLYLCTVQLQ